MKELTLQQIIGDPDARREWIKFQLRLRGSSLSAVGRALGVTKETVRAVFAHPYPRVEAEIARLFGAHPSEVWPERYNEDGTPKRRRQRAPLERPEFRGKRS